MKVIFKKQIHGTFASSTSTDVWLTYVLEMPFVPSVGMEVCVGEWEGSVESLCYANGQLFAFTVPDEERRNRSATPRSVDEIADEYIAMGWKRSTGILRQ